MLKIVSFLFFFSLHSNSIYSQKNVITTSDERIHSFVTKKAAPSDIAIDIWRDSLMKTMKNKWNISFAEVRLRFIIEKNGTLSDLQIYSEEWKPDGKAILELFEIISNKQKWTPAIHGGQKVRSNHNIKLLFQR